MIKLNEKVQISPKIKYYFLFNIIVITFILIALSSLLGSDKFFAVTAFCLVLAVLSYAFVSLIYSFWFYTISENSIILYTGVFIKKSKTIPFNSISSIEEKQGPIMAIFGIKSLKIWTASPAQVSTNNGSAIAIPDIGITFNNSDASDFLNHFQAFKKRVS